MMQGVETQSW